MDAGSWESAPIKLDRRLLGMVKKVVYKLREDAGLAGETSMGF